MAKRLYAYITSKSIKQRIYIGIALTAVITLFVFTIKANFFDSRAVENTPQDVVSSESSQVIETNNDDNTENTPAENELPDFHISLIDAGILLAVITVYCVHKYREKRKQRRL